MRLVTGRLLLLALALLLTGCQAVGDTPGAFSGTVVTTGQHVYKEGTVLPGALIVLEGSVRLLPGARVLGPVFVLGGTVEVAGTVLGDVSVIDGRLTLQPGARVEGDVRVGSGTLIESPAALVQGQVLRGAASGVEPEGLFPQRSLQPQLFWILPQALILALLAFLAARLIPRPVERVMRASTRYPVVSLAMGLLAGVVGLVLVVVMAFTLILLPVTFLSLVVGFLAVGYGWIGFGLAAGRWLAAWRAWKLSQPTLAFVGTFVFVVVVELASLLPWIGGWIGIVAAVMALGSVILTRFGLREFVPDMAW